MNKFDQRIIKFDYEKNLKKAGAEVILGSINELKNINLDLF